MCVLVSGRRPRPAKLETLAMKTALNKLAYNSYHMEQCIINWKKYHLHYWLEALRAKYEGTGKPYGKREFDKVLGEYDVCTYDLSQPSSHMKLMRVQAITDIPCILFVDELIAAYPEAKVILTNRDVDSWLRSMNNTFYAVLGWPSMNLLAMIDPVTHPYSPASTQPTNTF